MREIVESIVRLKNDQDALILAHNYQRPEVQDIADFVGDSFGLALTATKASEHIIIFCGVDFMAESVKILNPEKMVIHPDPLAQCPMAAMVDAPSLRGMKNLYPEACVVTYVNSTAEVKAETDICCTSSNAIKVIKQVKEKDILFVPDKNLGLYVKRFLPDKNIILWPGLCPTHHNISLDEILSLKKMYSASELLVHPECQPEVIDIADHVFSTEGMVNHSSRSPINSFIIGTERELCYRLKKENPIKTFIPVKSAVCTSMKRITLRKVEKSLETLQPLVTIPPNIISRAQVPLQRMMESGRGD